MINWVKYYIDQLNKANTIERVDEIRNHILYDDNHDLDNGTMFLIGELLEMTKQLIKEGYRK